MKSLFFCFESNKTRYFSAPSGPDLHDQLGSFMPLRAVSADKLPYQPRAPSAPEPDVDLSIYGVTVPVKRPGRLYQSTDYGAEVEDEWKDVEKATSEDKEQVRSM